LKIVVEDDGSGADPADVEQSDGHGLDLLRRRLDARYGEGASMLWHTDLGEGFVVTLELPAESSASVPALDVIQGSVVRP